MVQELKRPLIRKGKIDINYMLCVGCRLCEIACSKAGAGVINPELSRIRVLQFFPGPLDIPIVCHQCSDTPCIAACPPKVSALSINKDTGAVIANEKCVGYKCSRCVKACPHKGAIVFHPLTGKLLLCDLCNGDPACVKVCPTAALSYLPGSSLDGKHFALPPKAIAESLAVQFYPVREVPKIDRRS